MMMTLCFASVAESETVDAKFLHKNVFYYNGDCTQRRGHNRVESTMQYYKDFLQPTWYMDDYEMHPSWLHMVPRSSYADHPN